MNKIITILLLLVSTSLFSQYLEKGTIVTDSAKYEVKDKYIQDAKEEVKQRKRINFLEKKIDKLKHITSHKNELLTKQEELLDTISTLEARIETLREENELLHQEMIESCKNSIDLANARLTELSRKVGKLRRQIRIMITIIFLESSAIILLFILI